MIIRITLDAIMIKVHNEHNRHNYFQYLTFPKKAEAHQYQDQIQNADSQQLEEALSCILCVSIALRQLHFPQEQSEDLNTGKQQIQK